LIVSAQADSVRVQSRYGAAASQKLHGHQRAGQAGNELILCNGVNTIDVSRISGIDKAGHTFC
jgi:uncharacterized protein YsxB (DUF464 family)